MNISKCFNYKKLTGLVYILVVVATLVLSCGNKEENPYVGRMFDHSYAGQRTATHVKYRINAAGDSTSIAEFEGKFVWADYAAPWCKACIPQAQVIKNIEDDFVNVVFMTVMTNSQKQLEIPTRNTASSWANKFGFNRKLVVASQDNWGWIIPQHYFYSPEGQTLYHAIGFQSAEQIRETIFKYMEEWTEWKRSGTKARWMRFD